MPTDKPFVLCIDVGGPKKIGWATSTGEDGTGETLSYALNKLCDHLRSDNRAALGFEAPIWTPKRDDLSRITSSRGGIEKIQNRAWSAGAGCGALGAALVLMPWCMTYIAKNAGPINTSVDLNKFLEFGGLFVWEAFVSGTMKTKGALHHDDARSACSAFLDRWPHITSDVPAEDAINHAVSAALVSGLLIDISELSLPAIVIGLAESNA